MSVLGCLVGLSLPGGVAEHRVYVNALYNAPIKEIEPLLPQLVHVAISHKCDSPDCISLLRLLVVHVASTSVFIGLRLIWLVEAASLEFEVAGLAAELLSLRDAIKSTAVFGSTVARPMSAEASRKFTIFNAQQWFVRQLTEVSAALRAIPDRSFRRFELRKRLESLNEQLPSRTLFSPIGNSSDPVRWIARILAKECVVFSSRERAPYLLVVEVISDPAVRYEDIGVVSVEDAPRSSQRGEQSTPCSPFEENPPVEPATLDLLAVVFGESSEERRRRLSKESENAARPGWGVAALVVKQGDDIRQEEFALQMIAFFNEVWKQAGLTCCVYPYRALATTTDAGLIEAVVDAISVDSVKKAAQVKSLDEFFRRAFGGEGAKAYCRAQRNFAESMAGYSVICYLLQIKDRHNANLMLSRRGHLIHIDFGFMLASSPGGINFESAPFKLSNELVDVMGGVNSSLFDYYKVLVYQGFVAVRERVEEFIALAELLIPQTSLPCFKGSPQSVIEQLRGRFMLDLTETELAVQIKEMVETSVDNWRTNRYDQFQNWQNGIV